MLYEGSGTGCSCYLLSFGLGIQMLGIELNRYRFGYSLLFQQLLMQHEVIQFKKISKMTQFYQGDAKAILSQLFGTSDDIVHLRLIYWFREGWQKDDIKGMIELCNEFLPNLNVLVCDMSSEVLINTFGFRNKIISSVSFSGALRGYKNYRTLWVHRIKNTPRATTNAITQSQCHFLSTFSNQSALTIQQKIVLHWDGSDVAKASRQMRKRKGLATISMKDYESNAISHFHPPFAGFRSIEKDKFTDGCIDYDDARSTKLATLLDKQVATADKPSTTNSTISTCPSKKPILNAAQIIPRKRILGCHDSADNSLRTELTTVSYNRVERVYIPSSTNSIILRRPNKMPNFKPKIRSLGSHIITGRRIIRRLRVSKWVKAMSDKHFS